MGSNLNHAKQFMPFDSLKGFNEALAKKGINIEKRKQLSDTSLENLDNKFKKLNIGNYITVTYYNDIKYVKLSGIITKIDYIQKRVVIDNTNVIKIANIIDIRY